MLFVVFAKSKIGRFYVPDYPVNNRTV
jgi:hypothetical protein